MRREQGKSCEVHSRCLINDSREWSLADGKISPSSASYPLPFIWAFEGRAEATLASLQPFPLSGEQGDWALH